MRRNLKKGNNQIALIQKRRRRCSGILKLARIKLAMMRLYKERWRRCIERTKKRRGWRLS